MNSDDGLCRGPLSIPLGPLGRCYWPGGDFLVCEEGPPAHSASSKVLKLRALHLEHGVNGVHGVHPLARPWARQQFTPSRGSEGSDPRQATFTLLVKQGPALTPGPSGSPAVVAGPLLLLLSSPGRANGSLDPLSSPQNGQVDTGPRVLLSNWALMDL